MLSSVLGSERAVQVNIAIIRTFVKMRESWATQAELAQRLDELQRQQLDQDMRLDGHAQEIERVFEAIRELIEPPAIPQRRRIGYPTHPAFEEHVQHGCGVKRPT